MRLTLPPPGDRYERHRQNDMQDTLVRAMLPVVTTEEAVPHIFLRAPDGGVWRVSVTNAGALVALKVQG